PQPRPFNRTLRPFTSPRAVHTPPQLQPVDGGPRSIQNHVPAHRQPETVPRRPHGQDRPGPAQVGAGIPGRPVELGRLHEFAIGEDGGVHRRAICGGAGGGADSVQQCPLREGGRFEQGGDGGVVTTVLRAGWRVWRHGTRRRKSTIDRASGGYPN
ncbi:hypothetical protein ACHAXT_006646, partial [Thalassiosira profunda]